MPVVISVDAYDFKHLAKAKGSPVDIAAERGLLDDLGSTAWEWIYWLGAEYVNVILARSFLLARGCQFEIAWTESDGWAILTDYDSGK